MQYLLTISENVKLIDLHKSFQNLVARYHIPVMSVGEAQKTSIGLKLKVHMVPPESAGKRYKKMHASESVNTKLYRKLESCHTLSALCKDQVTCGVAINHRDHYKCRIKVPRY